MNYTQLISFLFSTSIITAALIYIAKRIFDKLIEAKLEKYKTSLQNDTENFRNNLNFETEKFKYELNTVLIEHQIRYSKLYEERGKVIQHIYNLLFHLEAV